MAPKSSSSSNQKKHARTGSEFVETDRNTEFVHRNGFWVMYIALIFGAWLTVRTVFFGLPTSIIWTIVVQAHFAVTFVLIHWIRGSPESQAGMVGEDVAHLTFWEQIEGGRFLGTPTRRRLTLIPIALFFLSLIWTQEDLVLLGLNSVSTIILLIAKSEYLFGVRLFGLNKLQE